jgi:serine/threonine-protein kinase
VAQIEVEGLEPGTHRFELVVVDDSGNRSQRDTATVVVVRPDNLVVVPLVVQRKLEEALKILKDVGLQGDVVDRVATNNPAPDTVLRQQPAAGTRAERGATVQLTIAVSVEVSLVSVPLVIGRRIADAERELSRVGLRMVVSTQVPGPVGGLVVFQNPTPGRSVPAGRAVDVIVSQS